MRSTTSRRSGLASRSASTARTGRRLAYRPSALRSPSSPCSGRGASGSVVSHCGPPTAASRTASAARQAASVSSVSAVPWASIDAPPNGCSAKAKSPTRDRTSRVGAVISGPIPSPGSTAMLTAMGRAAYGVAQSMTDVTDEAHASASSSRPSGRRGARPSAWRPRTRGCSTTARTSSSCWRWWPPRRTRRRRSSRRWARRSSTSARTCAGPSDTPTSSDPDTGTLRSTGIWYLEDEARYARLPRRQRAAAAGGVAAAATSWPAASRRGWPTSAQEPAFLRAEVAARGGAARGLRLPDPRRHAPGGRARVLHGGSGRGRPGAAARDGPDRRPARAGGRAPAGARRARALQRRSRGLRLRRLARPGRAAALGGGLRRRCSSASTASAWTTVPASTWPSRSTASSACSA